MEPARSSVASESSSPFCETLKRIAFELYDTAAKVVAYMLIGLGMQLILPVCTIPCLIIAAAIAVTRLAVKTVDWYDHTLLDWIKSKAGTLKAEYPRLPDIAFVIALIVSTIFVPGSIIVAIPAGVIKALYC